MPSPDRPPETSQDWRSLQPHVYRMVRKDLGPFLRSRLESADVVQDVLNAVAQDGEQWDEQRGTHFLAWVEGVVRNRIRNLDKLHKAKKRGAGQVGISLSQQPCADSPDGMPGELPVGLPVGLAVELAVEQSPAEAIEHKEHVGLLLQCIEDLSDDERSLILLRDYDGFPWRTIAEQTGRPTSDSARMAHGRAMSRLSIAFLRATRQGGSPAG